MSKHEKILAKLCRTPPPADLKWDELVSLLSSLGFDLHTGGKSGGSRRRFIHRMTKQMILCHEPHPRPEVDKGCIVDVVSFLRDQGFIGDDL